MKHVHVISDLYKTDTINVGLNRAAIGQVDAALYSLIAGLRQKNFGLESISRFSEDIRMFSERFLDGKQTFADSGGYSIIRGDVQEQDIGMFTECYNAYFEHASDQYDNIFTLDIPCSLGHPEINYKEKIYGFNHDSLSSQLEILERLPELKSKLFFVWQFKTHSLYEIWSRLVRELDINNRIHNRAIGGMVSLRKFTNIDFSPFIGIAFRCFSDYLGGGYYDDGFKLHFLGIKLPYDRFYIAFLEKLFARLMTDQNVNFTYDTVNHAQNVRTKTDLNFYDYDDGNILIYEGFENVPDELLVKVYKEQEVLDFVREELNRRKRGELLITTNTFGALNIYSNLRLDKYFEDVIDEYEMVDVLIGANSTGVVERKFRIICGELKDKYNIIFGNNMIDTIVESMEYTWTYADWFKNSRCEKRLDYFLKCFIDCIGFDEILN